MSYQMGFWSYFLHAVGQLPFTQGKEESIQQIFKERKRGKEFEFCYLYLTKFLCIFVLYF